jgi:cytochrome bd-type quinol oxidase subunit 2
MKTIFDLPAHPLFVHAPVVLLPILAIVAVVAAMRPPVGRKLGVWLPVAALVVFGSVFAAVGSGEALDDELRKSPNYALDIKKHADLAETTRLLAFLFLVATAAMWWFGRTPADDEKPQAKAFRTGLTVVTVVFAVLATVWVIRTGHEGARSHWKGVL